MKRLAIGLCSLIAGILLCAINWLGAAAALPAVTEWSGTRMNGAWKLVGHTPLVVGIVLLVVSVVLIASAFYEEGDVSAPASERARVQQAQQPDAQ